DPLHQWSRQWEYPFVFQSIQEELQRRVGRSTDILDAGSGATFFPFLLRKEMGAGSVTCCDYDATLEPIFETVNAERSTDVAFRQADLRALPFDDASFDIVYCVSVLEHTDQYEVIVREFHRVLRPGGVLIATFDIGLDGVSDIPPQDAKRLNDYIESTFARSDLTADSITVTPESITSVALGALQPSLLPWRYPLLSWLKSAWKRKALPNRIGKNLTVFCARYFRS
ncbi:MAG: class I SAM-dependent methyltransferase, partial [Eudoraea sp.]|uniref:class I SAM-dependent methyltransferase n=1 Tax=Eudoraea sp. TaxID=1979955 RepID=UPI003C716211